MKFLPFVIALLMYGCQGEPENTVVPDYSDTLKGPPPPPSVEEVLDEQDNNSSTFINDGEKLENIELFYCHIGAYGSNALMIIDEEITDEINGDGDAAEVSGYYYYVKHQKNLDLEGRLDIINGQYALTESYKGKESGYMEFSTTDYGDNYWSSTAGQLDWEDFNFQEIEPKDEDKRAFTIKKQKYSLKHDVMDMSVEEETWEEVEDKLAMVFIDDDKMIFDYSVVRTNFHTGSANGLAHRNTAGNYIFNGEEGCVLTFEVNENDVDITDVGCNYYHGARATLDGSFSK